MLACQDIPSFLTPRSPRQSPIQVWSQAKDYSEVYTTPTAASWFRNSPEFAVWLEQLDSRCYQGWGRVGRLAMQRQQRRTAQQRRAVADLLQLVSLIFLTFTPASATLGKYDPCTTPGTATLVSHLVLVARTFTLGPTPDRWTTTYGGIMDHNQNVARPLKTLLPVRPHC